MSWRGFLNQEVGNQQKAIDELESAISETAWLNDVEGRFVAPEDWVKEGIFEPNSPNEWYAYRDESDNLLVNPILGVVDLTEVMFYHDNHYWLLLASKNSKGITSMVALGFPILQKSQPMFYIEVIMEEDFNSYGVLDHTRNKYVGFPDLRDIFQNPEQYKDAQICVPTFYFKNITAYFRLTPSNVKGSSRGRQPTVKYIFSSEPSIARGDYDKVSFDGFGDIPPVRVETSKKGFTYETRYGIKGINGLFSLTPTLNKEEHPLFWEQEISHGSLSNRIPFPDSNYQMKDFIRENTFLSKIGDEPFNRTAIDVSDVKWLRRTDFPPSESGIPLEENEPLTSEYHHDVLMSKIMDNLKAHIFVPKNPIGSFASQGLLNHGGL
jgi:hypothetical protein